ncbi:MAG: hypothetical protein M1274_10550 [Actinobacteria bacterium]|nr:hypothetical protein [Actinomycetota bacterium]
MNQPSQRDIFMRLITVHDHGLRMLAFRLLGDREGMDDVLQDAYRATPSFPSHTSMR